LDLETSIFHPTIKKNKIKYGPSYNFKKAITQFLRMSEEEHIEIPAKHEALGEELNRAEDVDNLHTLLLAHEEHNEEEEEEEEELPEYKWITRYEAIHYYDTNRLLYYVLVVHDFVRRRIVKQKYFDTVVMLCIACNCIVLAMQQPDAHSSFQELIFFFFF
ncbi:hypothetical protein RFI_33551, partial [Reticulomyxa filosa]